MPDPMPDLMPGPMPDQMLGPMLDLMPDPMPDPMLDRMLALSRREVRRPLGRVGGTQSLLSLLYDIRPTDNSSFPGGSPG